MKIYFDYCDCKENQVRVIIDEEVTLMQALKLPIHFYVPDLIAKKLNQYRKGLNMINRLKRVAL